MESAQEGPKVHSPARPGPREDVHAALDEWREPRIVGRNRRDEPDLASRRREHAGRGRYAESSVEDEPPMRRDRRGEREAAGQERVVGEDRERADEDRVALLAQAQGVLARGLAGDPLRVAVPRRGPSVQRRRPLQVDERTAGAKGLQEGLVQRLGLVRERSDQDVDAAIPEAADPAPRGPRVGILDRADDARDLRRDQSLRAGRRATEVRTGLEVDEQRRALRARPRGREGEGLGVRAARALVSALPDHRPVRVDEDGPDARIRRRREAPAFGELEDAPPEDVERRRGLNHPRAPRRTPPHRSREGRPSSRPRPRNGPAAPAPARSPG